MHSAPTTRTSRPVIGVDLGGTHLQAGVVTPDGTIAHRLGTHTNASQGADAVLDAIAGACREACAGAGVGLDDLGAVGFAAPGAVDVRSGVVLDAPNLGWDHLPVADGLSRRLGGVPVILENDVNAAALAEARLGAGRGAPDALAIWVGTGVGGGIVVGGRIHRGPMGTAGEIGQMLSTPDLHDIDGARMERHASRGFVTQSIRAALEGGRPSVLSADDDRITSKDLASAYEQGDALVVEHVHRAVDWMGVAIANAVTLLGIPLILLGGGLAETMPDAYPKRLEDVIKRAMFPPTYADRVEVRVTELRENAGLLGAALTARDAIG